MPRVGQFWPDYRTSSSAGQDTAATLCLGLVRVLARSVCKGLSGAKVISIAMISTVVEVLTRVAMTQCAATAKAAGHTEATATVFDQVEASEETGTAVPDPPAPPAPRFASPAPLYRRNHHGNRWKAMINKAVTKHRWAMHAQAQRYVADKLRGSPWKELDTKKPTGLTIQGQRWGWREILSEW